MKLLRILTGVHAGAQLALSRRETTIGPDAEADIQITDWTHAPIRLTVEESRPVTASLVDAAASAATLALTDLSPRRFGDVVLCVGAPDAKWPSDIRLLERLVRTSRKRTRSKTPASAALLGATAGAALLSAFVLVVARSSAPANAAVEPLPARVQRAVAAAQAPGVRVRTAQGLVSVEGLVADSSEAARLRSAVQPFGDAIAHRYASAADISQSIADALANPGLSVSYRGDGIFSVQGSTMELDKVRGSLQRIATDLGPLVQRIEIAAAEVLPPARVPVGSMLSSEDLQYVQTRDGTKHLYLVTAPPSAEPTH